MSEHAISWYRKTIEDALAVAGLQQYRVGIKFSTGKRAHTFALDADVAPPLVAKIPRFFLETHLNEFRQEIRAQLDSTYNDKSGSIPRIQNDLNDKSGRAPVLIMDRVGGASVQEIIHNSPRRWLLASQPGNLLHVADLLEQTMSAVSAADWIHGDPSISNIRLVTDNFQRVRRVFLLDFGSARRLGSVYGDRAFGTPETFAPRQAVAGNVARKEDDLFSLGCIIYALATGIALPRDENHGARHDALCRISDRRLQKKLQGWLF